MQPRKLKLSGFAGIASGRGASEIEIDFTGIAPDAQLVALSGPNGAGKTTLMDNMHPYRVMPSRASSPTPSAFSFYEHIVGGQGAKELDWEHEGVQYRSVLKFRATAKTKKQEAFLFVVKDGVASPWRCDATGLVSDGKADTYDQAVESILGKPEVFFTAQFSAQGKQPIGKMTAGEVKSLLAQMLGMERIAALGAKAQGVIRELKPHLAAVQDSIVRWQVQIGTEDLPQSMSALAAELEAAVQQQKELRLQRDDAVRREAVAQRLFDDQESRRAAQAQLQKQLQQAQASHAAKVQALQQRHAQQASQGAAALEQAQQAVVSAKRYLGEANQRQADLQAVAAKASDLSQQCERQQVLAQRKQKLQSDLVATQPALKQLDAVRHSVQELQEQLARVQVNGEHIAAALEKANSTAALLGQVPCQGSAMAQQCKLLAQARSASSEVPDMQARLVDARQSFKDGRAKIVSQKSQLQTLLETEAQARQMEGEMRDLEQEIAQVNAALAQKPFVDQAVRDLPQARQQCQQAQEQLGAAQASAQVLAAKRQQEVALQQQEMQQLVSDNEQEQLRIREQISAIPPVGGEADLQAAQQLVRDLDQRERVCTQEQERIRHAMQGVQTKMARSQDARNQLVAAKAKEEALGQEIAQWTLLTKALGTDGIIAMQIDDAGPAISALANSLLDDCYGGRFQITLVTQAKTAAGIQKEAFLIQVEDTHRGETKLLDAMSGGEKVWINECLVRAIALHIAQTSDSRFETLFSDESDGALDPERKRQYMQMKRSVLERGGYSREYIITQTPELLNLCDAVIDVTAV